VVAFSLQDRPNPAPQLQTRSWSQLPDQIGAASQRRTGGGFNLSARAVLLYGAIQRCCRNQQHHRDGVSCGVSLRFLGAVVGVQLRQTRNLLRQLEELQLVAVDVGNDFRGCNTFRLLPVPLQLRERLPRPTPAVRALGDPRQNTAADTTRDSRILKSGLDLPEPTPGSGAGPSGPAPSAAGIPPPAAPAPRAPGARKPRSTSNPAGEGKTAKVIPLWDARSADWEQVVRRHLGNELPGIPESLALYALEQIRVARAEAAVGGTPLRNPLRYAVAVAKRHWGGFERPAQPRCRDVWRPEAAAASSVFLCPENPTNSAPGLSQGEPSSEECQISSEIERQISSCAPDVRAVLRRRLSVVPRSAQGGTSGVST